MVYCIWILLMASAILWTVIYLRVRVQETTIPSLDSTTALPDPPGGWPFLSVIVPARNEESVIRECLASVVRQDYPGFELIFVDDQSTDATARMARDTLRNCTFCHFVEGAPRLGEDWIGKSWALVQGVAQARGDWLLFVDADVVHHPATFKKAMAKAIALKVDALSILPTIDCRSFWEKCAMPLFALLSVLVEPLDDANHVHRRGSRLCGAFTLIQRSVYDAAGGHMAIRSQILEDMALAANLKRDGRRIWLTYTRDLTSTRMYENFHDLWMGLTRLSYPMLGYSPKRLLLAYLAGFIGTVVPWLTALAGMGLLMNGSMAGLLIAPAGAGLCLASRYAIQRVFSVVKVHPPYAWLLPLAAFLYLLAATHAALRHFRGKGLVWKQRIYREPTQGTAKSLQPG
jgi:hopene-associated glycosyltransferase HpnB